MNKIKVFKWLIFIMLLSMLIVSKSPVTVLADSARPPSIVILVNNPPKDLSIELVSNSSQSKDPYVWKVAWEGYYGFYMENIQAADNYIFKVTTNGKSFECKISSPINYFSNTYTLDINQQRITKGTYPLRCILLVLMQLILTLLIEGSIFLLFKYREKRSWIVFLFINIITQGALDVWLDSLNLFGNLGFALVIGEFFVFLVEMIAFPVFIKEHKKTRSLIYAIVANFISFYAGLILTSILPI